MSEELTNVLLNVQMAVKDLQEFAVNEINRLEKELEIAKRNAPVNEDVIPDLKTKIPSGAIENNLINRLDQIMGYYLFVTNNESVTIRKLMWCNGKGILWQDYKGSYQSTSEEFDQYDYFYKVDKVKLFDEIEKMEKGDN